ncbi:MAG TPA: hypothetical protein VJ809_00280 [Pirellulales bacterium]|nr:hypothetical protein [Pirellulales bacterium]
MSQRSALAIAFVLLIVVGMYAVSEDSASGQAAAAAAKGQQWEYQVLQESAQQNRTTEIQNKLTRMGDGGWEVCGVSSKMSAQGHGDVFYMILKRPKQ